MYCPKCGKENPDNAQVCSSCGSVLPSIPATAAATAAKTSGMAIASFVLAVLSPFTCLTTAIPAIILGIVSLVKIEKSAGRLKGKGLAIAGIAIGPCALPIVALLMGIMMPALARSRQVAFRMVCGNNLKNLGIAMSIYKDDYGQYPTTEKWCDLLVERQDVNPTIFSCRGAAEGPCNYAMNENLAELGTSTPPDMVLLFETHPGWNQAGGPEILSTDNHQGDGCNVLFVDMHVEFVRTRDLERLRWKPD